MSLYQSSVLNKYLATQPQADVKAAYVKYSEYFLNKEIQENIRNSKEEQFQEGFLRELFVNILGYTINPNPDFDLTTELKNIKDTKKTDGAILKADGAALAVIELKGTDTKDLDKVNDQAFNYKNNQPDCVYVITSNFEKLRFFIHNAVEHEEFNLFTLTEERFKLLWLFLQKDNLLGGIPAKVKEESLLQEEKITKALYADYSVFKNDLWEDMVAQNPQHDPLLLYKKSQKLLDRFLFIFFSEDKGLLPPYSISRIISRWELLKEEDAYKPVYDIFKQYFGYMDIGRKGKQAADDISAYNGGLFKTDELLDSLLINDELLKKHSLKLTNYDFADEVDTNILGHIFEHSLNDIENVRAQLAGEEVDKSKTKRKKDGVFYTPKYITKYIVDNTIGKLCEEKKAEIGIDDEEFAKDRKGRRKDTIKKLDAQLEQYREWLLQLSICDPACGSGAFLNQALEFLIAEHRYVDELETQLLGYAFEFSGVENHILENNIYGVDINEESVDIARLSLWLRTAKKGRKLTSLNSNIKCGNSLIDDPKVAGELAFNWQKEFPTIFQEKEKHAYHITTATHDSRTSQRMIDHKVRQKRDNGTRPYPDAIWLEPEDEEMIMQTLASLTKEDKLNILAANICGDHLHLLLVCEEEEVPKIVKKIKGRTSRMLHHNKGINPLVKKEGEKSVPLWTQKFSCKEITDQEQLDNTLNYIEHNRAKHQLPHNKALQTHIDSLVCSLEEAFDSEYKGGFDVVIGNPPYVQSHSLDTFTKDFIYKFYSSAEYQINTYAIFMERILQILSNSGFYSVIIPNYWLSTKNDSKLRALLFLKNHCAEVLNVYNVFEDATVDTLIVTGLKTSQSTFPKLTDVKAIDQKLKSIPDRLSAIAEKTWMTSKTIEFITITDDTLISFEKKLILEGSFTIADFLDGYQGMKPYEKGKGTPPMTREMMNEKIYHSELKKDDNYFPLIGAANVQRYLLRNPDGFIKYGANLAAPRKPEIFNGPRLLANRILSKSKIDLTYENKTIINNTDVFNLIPKEGKHEYLKFLLAILASKLCATYFKKSNVNLSRAAFPKLNVNNLLSFPIPEFDRSIVAEYTTRVDEIMGKKNDTYKLSISFLQSKFDLEKQSTKLKHWPNLDFKGFLAELKKKKIKLGLEEEAEWMEYFNKKKAEANTLQSEIDRIDKEIDQMVYQLYDLTEEEIAIVENS